MSLFNWMSVSVHTCHHVNTRCSQKLSVIPVWGYITPRERNRNICQERIGSLFHAWFVAAMTEFKNRKWESDTATSVSWVSTPLREMAAKCRLSCNSKRHWYSPLGWQGSGMLNHDVMKTNLTLLSTSERRTCSRADEAWGKAVCRWPTTTPTATRDNS